MLAYGSKVGWYFFLNFVFKSNLWDPLRKKNIIIISTICDCIDTTCLWCVYVICICTYASVELYEVILWAFHSCFLSLSLSPLHLSRELLSQNHVFSVKAPAWKRVLPWHFLFCYSNGPLLRCPLIIDAFNSTKISIKFFLHTSSRTPHDTWIDVTLRIAIVIYACVLIYSKEH